MEKTSPISLADDDVCFVLDQRGGGHRGHDSMEVGFTTTCTISA